MDKKFKIALKTRAKHGIAYEYMKENKLSRIEMAEKIGISIGTLDKILNFKWFPNGEYGSKATAEKLCAFFKCTIDEFLPPEVVEAIKSNKEIAAILQEEQTLYKEADILFLGFSDVPCKLLIHNGNQEVIASKSELREIIDLSLDSLPPRRAATIRKRFFEDKTLDEVAKEMGVHQETVRDNETKALRQLRHPAYSRKLKDFLD